MSKGNNSLKRVPPCGFNGAGVYGAMLGGLALASVQYACAQEVAAAAANPGELQTVVVTSEKRANSEQKTPIAMSVYTGDQLQSAGITDLRALSTIAPDVKLGGTVTPVLTMRGISSRDTTEIGDPAVVVATDGTYNNRYYALGASLYDIGRIEILRGPQGTLYGRNANGGLINIITNKPTKELEGQVSVDVGNYSAQRVNAVVNIPLSDTVQMRAAASTSYHKGYFNNAPDRNGDDDDSRSARVSLAFQPTKEFNGVVTVQQTTRSGVGSSYLGIPYVYNADGSVAHDMPVFPADPRTFTVATPRRLDLNDKLIRWNLSYDLPGAQISYIGGYDTIDYHVAADSSASLSAPVSFVQNEHPKTQNHELRVASTGDGAWAWQAGLYYFQEKSTLASANESPFSAGRYLATFGFNYAPYASSKALFGQTSYKLTDTLKLSAGVRRTRDEKSREGFLYFATNSTEPLNLVTVPQQADGSWNKSIWHAGLVAGVVFGVDQRLLRRIPVQAGGFTDISPYGPESVKGYEIGSKMRFLNNRAQLNLSAFSYDYSGQQVSETVSLDNGLTGTNILNAGKTRSRGVEGDLQARIAPIGKITLSAAYLRARFLDFVVANSAGTNVQLAGNRPPQSPTLSVGLGLEHEWAVGNGNVVGNFNMKYQTAQHFTFFNYANDLQKAYTTADVSATYQPNDSKWSVQVYVRNLNDKLAFSQAEESGFSSSYRYGFIAPRTFGVKTSLYW